MKLGRLLLLVGLLVGLAACSADTSIPGNAEDFLQTVSGDGVFEVTVSETNTPLPQTDRRGERFQVERVLWNADQAAIEGSEIVAENFLHPRFDEGGRYLIFVSHFPGDPVEWAVMFATDLEGTPVSGYDTPETRESLQRLLFPGETKADLIDALVEFSQERAAWLAAETAARDGLPQTGRRSRHWLGRETSDPLQVFLDQWTATPPDRRSLPVDISDLPTGAEEALGMNFVPYEVVVIDTDGSLADVDTLALRFGGVGILGDFVVDHDTGVTTILGWAPEGRIAALEAGPAAPGEPHALGTIDPEHQRGPINPNDEGVTAIVTITGGTADTRIVGRYEYDQTIVDLRDRIENAQP